MRACDKWRRSGVSRSAVHPSEPHVTQPSLPAPTFLDHAHRTPLSRSSRRVTDYSRLLLLLTTPTKTFVSPSVAGRASTDSRTEPPPPFFFGRPTNGLRRIFSEKRLRSGRSLLKHPSAACVDEQTKLQTLTTSRCLSVAERSARQLKWPPKSLLN